MGRTQTLPLPRASLVCGVCETELPVYINVTEASRTARAEADLFMGAIYAQS